MSKDQDKHKQSDASAASTDSTPDDNNNKTTQQESTAATTGKDSGRILDELASKNTASKPRARRRTGISRGLLIFILLLPVLAAGLFLGWQQTLLQASLLDLRQENQRLATELSSQTNTLASLQQAVNTPITPDNSALEQTAAELTAEIDRLRQQLAQLESRERVENVAPDYAWKIQEADYLVRQASLQLQLRGDVASALGLLQMADTALTESGQGGVFNARQALAADIAALQDVQPLDREGIYLRLDGLAASMAQIDLLESMRSRFEARRAEQSRPLDLADSAQGWLASGLEFLGEVFVWRQWDERPEAMLTAGQESVIKQSLRLLVKQAQLALLDRDRQLYVRSLDEARSLLQRYAATSSSAGQALMSELDALQDLAIDPPLPGLEQSSRALRQLLASER